MGSQWGDRTSGNTAAWVMILLALMIFSFIYVKITQNARDHQPTKEQIELAAIREAEERGRLR